MSFTATDRGPRLARRLVTRRLEAWGCPRGTEASDSVTLIAAELTANAVRHGHVRRREFRLVLGLCGPGPVILRVEVSDARGDRLPPEHASAAAPDAESGRGLWPVASLAARRAVLPRADAPGKTVWAEVDA
ncbi:ATP-binding protein [Streptomyces sp. ICBB 8177]|uniref:ATP-binding protein n=1 Tax=Streptomyces sp. ICBB 8177 TaxID=563922 RepID=UPI000D68512E|nr:ATP-binding protein [Streptomyces sp. ICBB 8177]PWI44253.1 ATP-binding protein [Streptomyces sp. ICBB 8177]